jgi:hypothetical protein
MSSTILLPHAHSFVLGNTVINTHTFGTRSNFKEKTLSSQRGADRAGKPIARGTVAATAAKAAAGANRAGNCNCSCGEGCGGRTVDL